MSTPVYGSSVYGEGVYADALIDPEVYGEGTQDSGLSFTVSAIIRGPHDRMYQEPVEVLVSPTTAKAQLYQEPLEVLVSPTTAAAQLYQIPVEVLLVVTPGGSFHLDAVIKATRSSSFTADAVVRRTQTSSFTLDAVLKTTRSGSFSVDASIFVPGLSFFSVDAVLRATRSSSFTLDARVAYSFHLDAVIRKTQAGSFSVDAIKDKATSSSFTLDARARKTQTSSFTVDAERRGLTSFTVNAYIALPLVRIFRDDFNRVTTPLQHLGGSWAWDPYDSFNGDFEQVKAYTDGSNLVMPTQSSTTWYDSYIGYPMPNTGHAYFDFYVPSTWAGTGQPTYGLAFDRLDYTGIYVEASPNSATWRVSQFNGETPYTFTPTPATWYRAHIAWDGTTATINVWKQSDTEPAGWQYSQPQQFLAYNPATNRAPFLDLYYFSNPGQQDARMDNIEVWTREPHWYAFGGFQVAATILKTRTGSFTLNAQKSLRFTLDAFIRKVNFTIDAVIRQPQSAVFQLSAEIGRRFTLNAQIQRGGTLTLDAVLKRTASSSTTLDAEVFAGTHLRSLKVDALVRRGGSGSWYTNAEIRLPHAEHDFSFTADAVLRQPGSPLTLTVDAVIISGLRSGSFAIDADTKGQNEKRGTIHLDAVIRQGGSGVFLIGWAVGGNGYFHLDAQIRGWFSLDAEMVASTAITGSFTVDARVTNGRDFRLDAVKRASSTHAFSLGAEIFATGTQGGRYFWLDSWFVQHSGTKSFTLDARIGGGFTIDAFIRPYFTIDAFIHTNAVVIWPPDPGGGGGTTPTDPNGNPLPPDFKASRKYQVVIKVGGHDVTGDINWARTIFTQNAKTNPGTFELVLYGPQPYDGGEDVHVELDGFRTFGGIVLQVERGYVFESDADWPVTTLRGADYNILFDKLITYNRASADDPSGTYNPYKSFAKGSLDTRIISRVFGSYVDLPAGFDYKLHVTSVGVAAPEKPWAMPTSGSPLRQVMQSLSQVTDAIWWIDPYLRLHYGSRSDITAPYPITTGAGGISSRQISMSEDMSQLVTDGFLWGTLAYTVEGEIVMDREQSSYYDSLGPWQYGEFRSDLHHQAYITRRLQSVIQRYGKPIKRAQVVIFEPGYQAGQVAEVILGEHGLDEVLVIRSMTLTFAVSKGPGNGLFYCVPRFELSIGLDPEEPWDIYDYLPFKNFPFDDPLGWNRCDSCQHDCIQAHGGINGCDCGITDDFTRTVAEVTQLSNSGTTTAPIGTSTAGVTWTGLNLGGGPFNLSNGGMGASVDGSSLVLRGIWNSGTNVHAGQAVYVLPVMVAQDHTATKTFTFRIGSMPLSASGFRIGIPGSASSANIYGNPSGAGGATSYIGFTTTLALSTAIPNSYWQVGTTYTVTEIDNGTDTTISISGGGSSYSYTRTGQTTDTLSNPTLSLLFDTLGSPTTDSVSFFFDDLDIPEVDKCGSVQFDDFNRTISGAWGTTPSGYLWSKNAGSSASTASVASATGATASVPTGFNLDMFVSADGPWDFGSSFVFTSVFTVTSKPGSGSSTLQFGAGASEASRVDLTWDSGSATLTVTNVDTFAAVTSTATVAVPIPVVGTQYTLDWNHDPAGGGISQARIYPTGSAAPGWQVTRPTVADVASLGGPEFSMILTNASGSTMTASFRSMDFAYEGRPCFVDCQEITMLDTFDDRSVTNAWGTASSGVAPWISTTVLPQAQRYRVAGGTGVIDLRGIANGNGVPAFGASGVMEISPAFGVPLMFHTRWRVNRNYSDIPFRTDPGGIGNNGGPVWVFFTNGSNGWDVSLGFQGFGVNNGSAPDSTTVRVSAIGTGTTFQDEILSHFNINPPLLSSVSADVPLYFANTWYETRILFTPGVGVQWKIWTSGATEPGFHTSTVIVPSDFHPGLLQVTISNPINADASSDFLYEVDYIEANVCVPVSASDPSAPGGPCEDPSGEVFGAVTSGWGCETLAVDGGAIELTGQAARSTLVLYNADTGEHIADGWFEDQAGKTFRVPSGITKVIACYRNYAPEIGSNPSIPRLTSPSVGRRNV